MVTMAPRISHRLIEAIVRLDDRSRPIAETHRRVGAEADRLGLTRPSYQRIRELVHESRRIRRHDLSTGELIWELIRPPLHAEAGIDRMQLLGVRPLTQ
jgi:hypothetical protein